MSILDTIYADLDFQSGELFSASNSPGNLSQSAWLEKGEWLSAAKHAGAEKIFFVENNPVAVFGTCSGDHFEKLKTFNRHWSLARPRLLFLASPGEITVCDLAQQPIDPSAKDPRQRQLKALAVLHDVNEIVEKLQDFHRDHIESGKVFERCRFGDLRNRADKSLIRDLKIVRRELIQAGLSGEKVKYAHALIGRSIFIRYLEDREILTEEYFRKVARQKAGWTDLLKHDTEYTGLYLSEKTSFYPRVLSNKAFTYALFRTLSRDFNGDMFPDVDNEEKEIQEEHLKLIQGLLYGNAGIQKKLFFYSYQFDIIPLDLISSIYEEFYHASTKDDEKRAKARQDGAFYTPPALAEFVLSRTLTPETLQNHPRVLDPACGSGIFLVEAFRRIVRYEQYCKKTSLSFDELKAILRKQIAGIEANQEAARITAFSLYLSMLHYLDPPSIHKQIQLGNKLPHLLASRSQAKEHYHCIWVGNTFDVEAINQHALWRNRFGDGCADVVVGNPPWGAPGNKADAETKERERVMLEWCRTHQKPIGDKEPSQAFLWRALDFLKDGGKAGMLASTGVLFKHNSTTQSFREHWMSEVRLEEVFNFAHVRKFFFKGADSPFIAICFLKDAQANTVVTYWSAKQVRDLKETQTVILSKYDKHIFQDEDLADYKTWKIRWFGRNRDQRLIQQHLIYPKLIDIVERKSSGAGYKIGNKKDNFHENILSLDRDSFARYETFEMEPSPQKVERKRTRSLYMEPRLIVKRAPEKFCPQMAHIVAKYITETVASSEWFYTLKLSDPATWKYEVLLGLLWSSYSTYYFFMITSQWGLWYDNIHFVDELLQFPVILDKTLPATNKIISIVDKLCNDILQSSRILYSKNSQKSGTENQQKLETMLDEAVFELYGLNEEQKDLIRDCCEVTIPFFYKPFNSVGVMPAVSQDDLSWIDTYIHLFALCWNAYLENDEEMRAEVHLGAHGNMLAIEFFPADKDDAWNLTPQEDSWGDILEQLGKALPVPLGTSQIVLDGIVQTVSDDGIIIIKRNEKRFWTRTLAREDAEATLCKARLKEGRAS